MKAVIGDISFGFIIILLTWLITYDNNFAFGLLTPIIVVLFMIAYYYMTRQFNWLLTILNFIVSLFVAGLVVDFTAKKFPDWNLIDEEYFPLSKYFIFGSIFWIAIKIFIDIILKATINRKSTIFSRIEKLIFKNN
jgi:hypothetical protein